jgi:hypothetical protein
LIEAIDAYEVAIETRGPAAAEDSLAAVDAIMAGTAGDAPVGGAVSELLSQAENRRFALVSDAEASARLFAAKAEQFAASPLLMVTRDWANAMDIFMAKPFVASNIIPAGQSAVLLLNTDPAIERELERARNRRESQRSIEERDKAFREQRYKIDQGIPLEDD